MQKFDFNEALKAIQSGKPITGSDGVLAPLIKQLTEAALSAEIDSYLEQNPIGNRHNGYSKKTVKSAVGSFEIETPRDRHGEFEPERGNSEASLRPSARRRAMLVVESPVVPTDAASSNCFSRSPYLIDRYWLPLSEW